MRKSIKNAVIYKKIIEKEIISIEDVREEGQKESESMLEDDNRGIGVVEIILILVIIFTRI